MLRLIWSFHVRIYWKTHAGWPIIRCPHMSEDTHVVLDLCCPHIPRRQCPHIPDGTCRVTWTFAVRIYVPKPCLYLPRSHLQAEQGLGCSHISKPLICLIWLFCHKHEPWRVKISLKDLFDYFVINIWAMTCKNKPERFVWFDYFVTNIWARLIFTCHGSNICDKIIKSNKCL